MGYNENLLELYYIYHNKLEEMDSLYEEKHPKIIEALRDFIKMYDENEELRRKKRDVYNEIMKNANNDQI